MSQTACSHCGAGVLYDERLAGQEVACPNCGRTFPMILLPQASEVVPAIETAPSQPAYSSPLSDRHGRRAQSVPGAYWCLLITVALICLVAGYFVGREHLKHQIASTMVEVAEGIAKSFEAEFDSIPETESASEPEDDPWRKHILRAKYIGDEKGSISTRLKFRLTNISGKDVDAAKGSIYVHDQFGDLVGGGGLGITLEEPLAKGSAVVKEVVWGTAHHTAILRGGKCRIEFIATDVIYSDGSREKF